MSIKLMAQVWDESEVSGSELLVLLAIADHANDNGVCWPSIPRLAKRARLSERQTQRVVQKLCDSGYIEILSKGDGRGHSTVYKMNVKGDKLTTLSDIKDDNLSTFDEERVTSATERVTSDALKDDIAVSPESLKNHHKEPSLNTDDDDNARVRVDGAVMKAWAENIPGTMTPILAEKLHDLTDECGAPSVIHGIVTSVEAGARNFKYIAACARNHAQGNEPPSRNEPGYRRPKRKTGYSDGPVEERKKYSIYNSY